MMEFGNFGNQSPQPFYQNQMMPNMGGYPQPIEPIAPNMNVTPEPMYQTLSEQKPTFAPTMPAPIPDTSMNSTPIQPTSPVNYTMNNNIPVGGPVPTLNTPINNPNPEPVAPAPIPTPVDPVAPAPVPTPQPAPAQPVSFVYGPQQQNNNNPYMQ